MIRIKCGTCGTSQGYKTSADGVLSLPKEEEKRLVSRGVAVCAANGVFAIDEESTAAVQAPVPPERAEHDDGDTDARDPESGTEAAVGGEDGDTIDPAEIAKLERMTKSDLEKMAQDMGVDISRAKNNRERAMLIASAGEPDGDMDLSSGDLGNIVR